MWRWRTDIPGLEQVPGVRWDVAVHRDGERREVGLRGGD